MKIFHVLFILFLSIGAVNGQQGNNTLLWKISGNGLTQDSYLYGTMHVKDSRMFEFSDSMITAFNKCDAYAMESLPDSIMSAIINQSFENIIKKALNDEDDMELERLQKIKEIQSLIEEDDFSEIKNHLKDKLGVNYENLKTKDPKNLTKLIEYNPEKFSDKEYIMDVYLCEMAERTNKKTFSVESNQTGSKALDELEDLRRTELRGIQTLRSNIDTYTSLRDNYLSQDLDKILEFYSDSSDYMKGFFDKIITQRNHSMDESIDTLVQMQSTFIGIGAGHLPGEEGVIALLQKRGYQVTPVFCDSKTLHHDFNLPEKEIQWEIFKDTTLGYVVNFPDKVFSYNIPFSASKMNTCMDLLNNSVYYTMALPVGPQLHDDPDLHINLMMDKFKKSMPFASVSKKRFKFKGHEACEFTIKKYPHEFGGMMVLREGIEYILFWTEGDDNKDIVKRFKTSLSFIQIKELPEEAYTSNSAAFKANFNGKVVKRVINDNLKNEEDARVEMFISTSNTKGLSQVVSVFDYSPTIFFDDDKYVLKTLMENAFNNAIVDSSYGFFQGYPSVNYTYDMNNEYGKGIACLRANRVYMILTIGSREMEKDMKAFLNTIEFIEFSEPKWDIEINERFEYAIQGVPDYQEHSEQDIQDLYGIDICLETYNQSFYKEFTNGLVYFMEHKKFKDYFSFKNDSSLIQYTLNEHKTWSDSIINIDTIYNEQHQIQGLDYTIQQKLSKNEMHLKTYFTGQEIITVCMVGPKEYTRNNADFSEPFFDAFKIVDGTNCSLSQPKKQAVLSSIRSCKDNDQIEQYGHALEQLDFTSKEKDQLYDLLMIVHPDEMQNPNLYWGMSKTLFKKWVDAQTKISIKDAWKLCHNTQSSVTKNEVITHLLNLDDHSQIEPCFQYLTENPNISWNYQINNSLRENIKSLNNNFHSIENLLNDSTDWYVLNVFKYGIDSGVVSTQLLNTVKPKLVNQFKNLLKIYEEIDSDSYYQHYSSLTELVKIMNSYPNDEEVERLVLDLHQAAINRDKTILVETTIFLGKKFDTIEGSIVDSLISDPFHNFHFISRVHQENLNHLLNDSIWNNDYLVPCQINSYLYEEWYELPDTLVLKEKIKIRHKEKEGNIWVYELSYNESDQSHYIMLGPISESDLQVEYSEIFDENYDSIEHLTPTEFVLQYQEYYQFEILD